MFGPKSPRTTLAKASTRTTMTTPSLMIAVGCLVVLGLVMALSWSPANINHDALLLSSTATTTASSTQKDEVKQPQSPVKLGAPLTTLIAQHKKSLRYFGTKATNTGWNVDVSCLQAKDTPPVVYGVGAGEDISWDTGLVDAFDATVYMFDPTEKSIQYTTPIVQKYAATKPNKLFHTPEGLADQAGTLTFHLPANPNHVSMRQESAALDTAQMPRTVTVPVNTLQVWMSQRHHQYLDVLKIDIEGSEYAVLEALIQANFMPFTQLLVEYHNRFLQDRTRHTKLLQSLRDAGFVELWSQNAGQEVGYIKAADLPYCADGTSPRHAGITKLADLQE